MTATLPRSPSIALAKHAGFLAGANAHPFRGLYRAFRSEYGPVSRTILVALYAAWWDGMDCLGAVMPTRFPLPVIVVESCPVPPDAEMQAAFELGERIGYSYSPWRTATWTPRGMCWRLRAEFDRGFAYGYGCRTRE